jgi:hypothetical protein
MQANHSDPVIDEIREVRHRISERYEHDAARLVAHYMEFQERYQDRILEMPLPEKVDQPAA